ncbi:Gfo/Idh/MocA family protein [Chloroflexota bacterium]
MRVGCAPDTFMGGGGQTARSLIEEGAIGKPIAATAFMMVHGHESWHPNPFFYYDFGGGPMLDMGPYYLTALVNLMGAMKRVSGSVGQAFDERIAEHEDVRGQKIPVKVATHIAGTIDFENGAIATVVQSFDVWNHNLSRIEIHGTEGSLVVPDPNCFDGEVMLWQPSTNEWENVPLRFRSDIERGAGVADMARCIENDVPHKATGEMAYHVLDAMLAFVESSNEGKHIILESTTQQPDPVDGTFKI